MDAPTPHQKKEKKGVKKVAKKAREPEDGDAPKRAAKRIRVVSGQNDEAWRKTFLAATNAEAKFGEAVTKFVQKGQEDVREMMSQRASLQAQLEDARALIEEEKEVWARAKADADAEFAKMRRVEQADWDRDLLIRNADEARETEARKRTLDDELARQREEATIEFNNDMARDRRKAVEKWAKEEDLTVIDTEEISGLRRELSERDAKHAAEVSEVKKKSKSGLETALSRQKLELTLTHEKEMARADAKAEAVAERMEMYRSQIEDQKEALARATQLTESVAASAAAKAAPVYVPAEAAEGGAGRRR